MSLTVGSTYLFRAAFTKDGLPWPVLTVTLTFSKPPATAGGAPEVQTVAAAVDGNIATYAGTTGTLDRPGNWRRRWTATDAGGVVDHSPWIGFRVDP